jgi:hypothetical protein
MKKLSDKAIGSSAGTSEDVNTLFFNLALILRRRECTDREGVVPGCRGSCSMGGQNGLCAFLGKDKFQLFEIVRGMCPFGDRRCDACAGYYLALRGDREPEIVNRLTELLGSTCLLYARLDKFNTPMLRKKLYAMFASAYPLAYKSLDSRWEKQKWTQP